MTDQGTPSGPADAPIPRLAQGPRALRCPLGAETMPVGPHNEASFDEMFPKMQRYIDVLACRAFGDSAEYEAFLRANAQAECEESRLMLEAIDFFAGINASVTDLLRRLEQANCKRILAMCEAVRRTPTMPQRETMFWNICSVTGVPSRHCLEIPLGNVSETARVIFIDISFAAFVRSFWVLTHIPALEQNRVNHHARAGVESKNIASAIKQFQAGKHFATHRDIQLYCRACAFVISTLEATAKRIGV